MSLTVASQTAQLGLLHVEQEIAIVSSNINNADRAGYTRKTLQSVYATTGLVTVPTSGFATQAVPDALLAKQVNQQSSTNSYASTISDYLSSYSQAYGGTGADATTLSSTLNTLSASLQILEADPSDSSAKAKVIATAQTVSGQFNSLSSAVQQQRLSADNDISTSIATINQSLQTVFELNKQISNASVTGQSAADLEDQRNSAVQNLSQQMGVQYFLNDKNQMIVYSPSGSQLVGSQSYATLSYSAAGTMSASISYPGSGIQPIMLNGSDITTSITTGKLGALIQLRDTTFPNEQAKLDNLAASMKSTINGVLNQGTSYPPLTTVTGTEAVSSGTALSATGTMRVAVTDQSGIVQNYADLNLSSYATVGALVTALNAIPNVSATISGGYLKISSTAAGDGISINPMNSSVGGENISQFFGFNDLFTNNPASTSTASDIKVNTNLLANTNALATGTLTSGSITAGSTRGITSGDGSIITSLITTLNSVQSFGAAGNFGARTATLSAYAGAIIADAATQASSAQANADTANATFTYLSNNYSNKTGVNVNEETANLTTLQTYYQANAQLLATVKDLFNSLLQAVR